MNKRIKKKLVQRDGCKTYKRYKEYLNECALKLIVAEVSESISNRAAFIHFEAAAKYKEEV